MKIFFLTADKPIIKSYELDQHGVLVKHSYPFVYEVTSHEENPKTLQDLTKLMQRYAKTGACMVKGELQRPLVTESRKGTTDPNAKTDWICLDLDGIEGFQTVDQFLEAIGCGDVDYVLQWSSSMGVENKAASAVTSSCAWHSPRTLSSSRTGSSISISPFWATRSN